MQTSSISFVAPRGGGGSTQATTGEILRNDTDTVTIKIPTNFETNGASYSTQSPPNNNNLDPTKRLDRVSCGVRKLWFLV